ncbi:hypothetical protein [Thiomicrorhabdus sp. Milos-T2]|uniref:hypothetical protein n=1 Tax=Thiomicrorhabdus sp. Milos-T2 TaxID=90814 RepID=UPI000493E91B|nr:hypothetical protein [Thiomicrorhabdus sp. Milos-T2]
MNSLNTQNIVLLGLPGSGKSRVASNLHKQFDCINLNQTMANIDLSKAQYSEKTTRPGCFEWNDFLNLPQKQCNQTFWLLIDVRNPLPKNNSEWLEESLKKMLMVADGIVFTFTESASLDDQAWWNQWLTNHAELDVKKPVVRFLNQSLPVSFKGFVAASSKAKDSQNESQSTQSLELETFCFQVERIVLEHLLMGLDSSRQNLGMQITRVKAVVKTLEYANLVEIEGTPYRWDTFAADESILSGDIGKIEISGIKLDQAWLKQLVDASKS